MFETHDYWLAMLALVHNIPLSGFRRVSRDEDPSAPWQGKVYFQFDDETACQDLEKRMRLGRGTLPSSATIDDIRNAQDRLKGIIHDNR